MKLWGGRFGKETNQLLEKFNNSIEFDQRLYKEDIQGSIAHVKMLGKQNIISQDETLLLCNGLEALLLDIENHLISFDISAEDIHMNIESLMIEKLGDVAKKIHTGRSRNDQVALDMRMYVKHEIIEIKKLLHELLSLLLVLCENHTKTILPGYTHLQRAQPTTLSHHFMAYFEMFKRDYERLEDVYKRTNYSPLGAGAFTTSTYPIDRDYTAKLLGFENICLNSMDAVSDRDFIIEFSSSLSTIIMHLSRFSEEIILWASHEFKFIELDDAYSTGSSIMPQKKNPDIAELVRGKTGRVYGNLLSILTTMKGIPLAYNKDMQEDKEMLFDSIDTIKICLEIFRKMLETTTFLKENMLKAAQSGFTNATDAADYLVYKGLAFRDAHEVIGKLVAYCIEQKKDFDHLSIEEYQKFSPLFEKDIFHTIDLYTCISKRTVIGGPSKEAMEKVIEIQRKWLKSSCALF